MEKNIRDYLQDEKWLPVNGYGKDFIHLYLGCELKTRSAHTNILKGIEYDNLKWGKPLAIVYYRVVGGGFDYTTSDTIETIKLILRPLSDISDEEREQMRKECPTMHSSNFANNCKYEAQRTNWLRKRGFDVDELIESGLAIDKTKITAEQ